ncbi:hypothetical protein U8C35_07715 [Sinorhizobium medicae]|uniref:hypothetical protein n=1 Tax=Sinorhizobium medicae TaxID=110321 RepID=UPI002AF6BDEC|nr:hypothetical protein [Sinorhizobium medicae]WQO60298.1 hypothetical protein U8C35_07715 [Sinorhizobium medicae]
MNHYSGYAHPIRGGWWAMLRFAKDGRPKPLMGPEDKPIVFPDELTATKAVLKNTFQYFNGEYLRDGAKAERFAAADSLFNLRPIRKNGKVIEVERRRAGA